MTIFQSFKSNKDASSTYNIISFNKRELEPILRLYGQMVSKGEWRDYSVSSSFSYATFSIFRRSSERPLYIIKKTPGLSKKFDMYSVVGMDGRILKHGKDLKLVLQVFTKKLFKII